MKKGEIDDYIGRLPPEVLRGKVAKYEYDQALVNWDIALKRNRQFWRHAVLAGATELGAVATAVAGLEWQAVGLVAMAGIMTWLACGDRREGNRARGEAANHVAAGAWRDRQAERNSSKKS